MVRCLKGSAGAGVLPVVVHRDATALPVPRLRPRHTSVHLWSMLLQTLSPKASASAETKRAAARAARVNAVVLLLPVRWLSRWRL